MKILVRAPNWIGDAVMAIPALEAIRRERPGAEITVLARPLVADLLEGQSFADRLWRFENGARHGGWLGRERLAGELRQEKFDAAVLLQNAFEAAWIAWRAGIPERIGYARDARGLLLTKKIQVLASGGASKHQSHYYLELLHRAGWIDAPGNVPPIRLFVSDGARSAAEDRLRTAGVRPDAWRCAIAPGATYGDAKCWPSERFAAVADRLISECGAEVLFFGSPAEKDIAARIRAAMRTRALFLVGETTPRDLPALLSCCSLFVGNDSGAMHVAAAVGLPVVGIFGPTDPEATAPVTNRFTLIREPVSCSPCFLRRCPIDHRCMERIPVDTVFTAAGATLGRKDLISLRGGHV